MIRYWEIRLHLWCNAGVREFKRSHFQLGESTVKSLKKKKYGKIVKSKNNKMVLSKKKRGRPLMLSPRDKKVKNVLIILRGKVGVLNFVVVIAVAQALIEKSTDDHLKCIDLISSTWTQSLFRRIGFVRGMYTTDKLEISDPAVMETKSLNR